MRTMSLMFSSRCRCASKKRLRKYNDRAAPMSRRDRPSQDSFTDQASKTNRPLFLHRLRSQIRVSLHPTRYCF
jgi:hypothetical protein